jgi:hypothetical protein
VKAFHFHLEQALRWRATQVDLEKSQVSMAAGRLAAIRADMESRRNELKDSAIHLVAGITGSALESLAVWTDRMRRHILELEKKAQEAERVLAARMQLLVQANQKRELLEHLKRTEHAHWLGEIGRELDAFAGEAFLGRLQSKSARARSSGG